MKTKLGPRHHDLPPSEEALKDTYRQFLKSTVCRVMEDEYTQKSASLGLPIRLRGAYFAQVASDQEESV